MDKTIEENVPEDMGVSQCSSLLTEADLGKGKGFLLQAHIHIKLPYNKKAACIAVCAAFLETWLESELFSCMWGKLFRSSRGRMSVVWKPAMRNFCCFSDEILQFLWLAFESQNFLLLCCRWRCAVLAVAQIIYQMDILGFLNTSRLTKYGARWGGGKKQGIFTVWILLVAFSLFKQGGPPLLSIHYRSSKPLHTVINSGRYYILSEEELIQNNMPSQANIGGTGI